MSNIHVIIGEDDYLVSETAKKLIGDTTGLEVIDSMNASNAELQLRDLREADASFSTPPFLDPQKVTWWKNVHFLPGGGRKDSSAVVKEALEKFARKLAASPLPENQRFVLSGPHLLQNSIFAQTLKAVAEMVVFAAGKPWEQQKHAVVRAVDLAAELGLKFEPGVADAFVARVGTDTRSLKSELNKLRDYLGPERQLVAAADVAEITSQGVGVEPVVWAVTDAIGERDLAKTLAAVKPFELENGFGVLMTTAIEKFFRQLVELKDAEAQQRLKVATEGMAPFAVRKLSGFLRNWSLKELRVARFRFLTLREKVVTSSGSADQLVVLELVRTLRRATR